MKKEQMANKMNYAKAYNPKEGSSQWRKTLKKAYKHSGIEQKQKGKESLESVGKNEGEKHYLGNDEQPVT